MVALNRRTAPFVSSLGGTAPLRGNVEARAKRRSQRAIGSPSANIEHKNNNDNCPREPSEEACKDGLFTFCSDEDVGKPTKLKATAVIRAVIADCSDRLGKKKKKKDLRHQKVGAEEL